MKIKTKKTMNLPQLIEWAFKNDITNEWYRATNDIEYISEVFFNISGLPQLSDTVDKSDLFTIEVEEVVDEDTKLPKSLAIFEHNGKLYSEMHGNKNINDILKMDIKVKSSSTKTIHMVNDDGTHTLIWTHEKGLVE